MGRYSCCRTFPPMAVRVMAASDSEIFNGVDRLLRASIKVAMAKVGK